MAEIRKSKSPAKYNSYVRKKLGLDPVEKSDAMAEENKPEETKEPEKPEDKPEETKEPEKPEEKKEELQGK